MTQIKVAAGYVNTVPMDWQRNTSVVRQAILQAKTEDVALLCLPELCLTGYGCEDMFAAASVQEEAKRCLISLLPDCQQIAVSVGLPLWVDGALRNAACFIVDGEICGVVCKKHLAGSGVYYEPRWFRSWPVGMQDVVTIGEQNVPAGDLFFEVGGVRIGFEICEDAWVADRPGRELSEHGIDILLNPSASHFSFGKIDTRVQICEEAARAFGVGYIYSNLMGNESGRIIFDGGPMIAVVGKKSVVGERLTYSHWGITQTVIDIDALRRQRRVGREQSACTDDDPAMIDVDYPFADAPVSMPATVSSTWEGTGCSPVTRKNEEFLRAVALGLWDYLAKSRSHGFVVSLSGGADSAAVACLCAYSFLLAEQSIGLDEMKRRLSYIGSLQHTDSVWQMIQQILVCVYQKTENSSETTQNAAQKVAAALGAEFLVLDVDPLVSAYRQRVEQAIGRQLTWNTDDITLQNIQARVRGPSVWMIANIKKALLLATSNRSEAAVGYATMDGDTCGGLSPIAGIDKAFLREWLQWMQTEGPHGLKPIPDLHYVTEQAPTAELRPASAKQTDEQDLMPYDILDAIEGLAIGEKLAPIEVYLRLRQQYPTNTAKQLGDWVDKFFILWCQNQWKRERYAPSFHVDDTNLDPKTWCRFPILSGNYQKERKDLLCKIQAGDFE